MCRGDGLWEEVGHIGTSGNRDRHLASKKFLEVFHRQCFGYFDRQFIPKRDSGGYNIPVRIRCVDMDYMGNFRKPWVILNMENRSSEICWWICRNRRSYWNMPKEGSASFSMPLRHGVGWEEMLE